eukprot:TRINITY_DN32279_c0_g1_i8.p1 TRINITY_DN32279_c0_g1~~TRINITY_DN32279_c0_g1_i8.p1  ORF type:complete len:178 (-),score=11.46 TRINITY_DN32279_c0_g1_i8:250-783(-)
MDLDLCGCFRKLETINNLFQNLKIDLFAHSNRTGIQIWRAKKNIIVFFSFKSIFQAEHFLTAITDKWHRLNFARFRLRAFGLNANKRWFQPGTSTESPCPLCGFSVDDEKHFLFQCRLYDTLREKHTFFELDMTKKHDVVSVLSSDDELIIQSVAKFIAEAYKIRQSHVNHNSSEVK